MATISALGIGSGLDLNGLLDQLEDAERQKLGPINRQKADYQAKVSAYGNLQGALTQFQSAAAQLNNAEVFSAVKSTVTGSSVTAAASNDAAPGSYQVQVNELARNYSIATAGVADKGAQLGAGTITIDLNNGEQLSVEIKVGKSSLEDVRNAINAAGGGVSASLVNDGSGTPWRLVLSSNETGTEAAIQNVDFGALTGLALDGDTEVTARNASLTVNGINITSQSNQVEGAIQGVTLALAEEGQSTLKVARDNEGMTKAVKDFVSAYNSLQRTMGELTSFNAETGEAGKLLGDATLRNVQSRLRMEMTGMLPDGELSRLSDLGITVQLNGQLKVDDQKLNSLVSTNPGALAEFFAGSSASGGFAGKLNKSLDQMVRPGGLIDNATNGLKTSIKSLDTRYARMEQSIDSTIARYRAQFAQLDSMIASMNSTSAYLTQQFDMMNAQLNQGRR